MPGPLDDLYSMTTTTDRTRKQVDHYSQAQLIFQAIRTLTEGQDTNTRIENLPLLWTQFLMSLLMLLPVEVDRRQKIIHIGQSVLLLSQIAISITLYYSSTDCSTYNSSLCKASRSLDLFYQGFLLFAFGATKALKINEARLTRNALANLAAQPVSLSNNPSNPHASPPPIPEGIAITLHPSNEHLPSPPPLPRLRFFQSSTAPTSQSKQSLATTDSHNQAQIVAEIIKSINASSASNNSPQAMIALIAQTLSSLFMMIFQPDLNKKQKMAYLIPTFLTTSQIVIFFYLYHQDVNCEKDTSAICKTANLLNLLYGGLNLFLLFTTKYIKHYLLTTPSASIHLSQSQVVNPPSSSSPFPEPHTPPRLTQDVASSPTLPASQNTGTQTWVSRDRPPFRPASTYPHP